MKSNGERLMNRTSRQVTTLLPVIGFLVCIYPSRALGSLIESGEGGLMQPVAPMNLNVNSPALQSGASLSALELPQFSALPEIALPAAALPSYSKAFAQI